MKTQILTVLSVILLGVISTFGMPTIQNDSIPADKSSIQCVVYTGQDGLINFRMEKAPGEVVMVGLYTEKGSLMSTRRFKKLTNVKLLYDLSQWPEGLYQIRVKSGNEVVFTSTVSYPEASLAGK